MEPIEEAVNTEESSVSEDQVVKFEAEDTAAVSPEQESTEPQSEEQEEATTPVSDRPVQNYEAEWHRKYENLVENLPKMIEESVKKVQTPEKSQYSVEQLEAFLDSDPEPAQARWARQEIRKIEKQELLKELEQVRQRDREQLTQQQIRQQAEAAVVNDPRYADAFVTLPNGNKQFNPNSKLAQLIGNYMQDSRLKNQPDAMLIAAKLARADLLDTQTPQNKQKLDSLKRQNANLKKQTLVEGGGVPAQQKKKDSFEEARERLSQTGSKSDAQRAVQEYFRKAGVLK